MSSKNNDLAYVYALAELEGLIKRVEGGTSLTDKGFKRAQEVLNDMSPQDKLLIAIFTFSSSPGMR